MALAAPLRAAPVPPVPVARLMVGQPVETALELLPRLFNLCAGSQRMGLRLALGLSVTDADRAALNAEIRRAHALQLGVILPRALGVTPHPSPMELDGAVLVGGLDAVMATDTHIGRLLRAIDARFPPGRAGVPALPDPDPETLFTPSAIEVSVALQHRDAPLMLEAETRSGRGALWRVLGLAMVLSPAHGLPKTQSPRQGAACVPAARGPYALAAAAEDGRITEFLRVTPTDHMLAPGGIMEHALATCPPEDAMALLAILDPCHPVTLQEAAHA